MKQKIFIALLSILACATVSAQSTFKKQSLGGAKGTALTTPGAFMPDSSIAIVTLIDTLHAGVNLKSTNGILIKDTSGKFYIRNTKISKWQQFSPDQPVTGVGCIVIANVNGILTWSDTCTHSGGSSGTVTSVTANAPLSVTGTATTTPNIVADTTGNAGFQTKFRSDSARNNLYTAIATKGIGSVTNFSKTDGYAIASTVTNPTTTPNHTISVDSAALSLKYVRFGDSATTYYTKFRSDSARNNLYTLIATKGVGSVTSVGSLSGLFTTTNQTSNPTFSLNSQSAKTVFTSPSTGIPSFNILDSSWITGIHTQPWNDLHYQPIGNITGLVTAGTNVTLGGNGTTATPYVVNASGGATRNFDSLTVGQDYARVGSINIGDFTGGSLPAGWTQGSGLTVTYTGAKANITGATSLGAPGNGLINTAFTSALQYNLDRMPYDKVEFSMPIVVTSKVANALVGVVKGVNGFSIYTQEGFWWDLSNGVNSGRFTVKSTGSTAYTIPTFNNSSDSTSKANFSVGDSLILYYSKNGWSTVGGIINKTTGQTTRTEFNQITNGSGGLFNFAFLNGTYTTTGPKIKILDRKGGVLFLTTSQLTGSGNTIQAKRVTDVVYGSNYKYVTLIGLPSASAYYVDSSGIVPKLITQAAPSRVFVEMFYNDYSEGFNINLSKRHLDSIIKQFQNAGIPVTVIGNVPRGTGVDPYNDTAQTQAALYGCRFVDIRTALKTSAGILQPNYNWDNVHINDSGSIVVVNSLLSKAGDSLMIEPAADTLYKLKAPNLPMAKTGYNAGIVVQNDDGTFAITSNRFPDLTGWIPNKLTSSAGVLYPHQGLIYESGQIKTDNLISITNPLGIVISGSTGASSTGSIQIHNFYNTSTFIPLIMNLGAGNTFISNISTNRPNGAQGGSMSGINNFWGNMSLNTAYTGSNTVAIDASQYAPTSGNFNIGFGLGALRGCTTCSNVIDIDNDGTGFSSNVSNTISLGSRAYGFNNDPIQAGDFGVTPASGVSSRWWVGGRAVGANNPRIDFTANVGANQTGNIGVIGGSRSTGFGEDGAVAIQFASPSTTSSNLNNTYITGTKFERLGTTFGSATTLTRAFDAAVEVDINSAANVGTFLLPRVTSTQETALTQGILTAPIATPGTGQTAGNYALVPSGGTGSGLLGYATVSSGIIQSVTITNRGAYTVVPTNATIVSGGTPGTVTFTLGSTEGSAVYNTTTHTLDINNGSGFQAIPNSNTYLASGTGSATTISIPHGLSGITSTSKKWVTANNAASGGFSSVTIDAVNVNIIFTVAPANGTNNLSFDIMIKP